MVSVLVTLCALLYPGEGAGASPAAPATPPAASRATAAGEYTAGDATSGDATSGDRGTRGDGARGGAGAPATASVSAAAAAPLPAAAPGLADGPECPSALPTGWLAEENQRKGEELELPSGRASYHSVVGYPDRPSAICGELVTVQLSGPQTTVRLVAYRIGHYRGAGAREVWHSAPIRVSRREIPSGEEYPHLVEPQWPMSTTIPVDGHWTPGFYLLVPYGAPGTAHAGEALGPAIPLTVRDDSNQAPVLFKASTLTWGAYGDWGGWSLYHGPSGSGAAAAAARARVVSLRRPLTGAGYEQMAYMDLPVVRQLEEIGLDVAYTTDEDVHLQPQTLLGHAEIVSGGHSEYWTRAMYDGLLQAGDAGVNLVFLGANNLWWQARLEQSPQAARPDRLVVYRVLADDPVAKDRPLDATVLWGPPPLYRDPAAVLGESHAAIGVHGGLQVMDAPSWFLSGSGLTTGSVLPGAVGNEAAGYNVRGRNPATTQVLMAGVLRGAHGPVVVSADYSTMPSGAAVFAAGTTDWACIPAGDCFDTTPPPATAGAIAVLTRNVIVTMATPRAGLSHPSTPVTPFVAAQLMPRLAPAAIGSYGAPTSEEKD